MKNIIFALIGVFTFMSTFLYSQTYTTGVIELFNDQTNLYTAQIDVSSTLVTLTLSGPDNKYLGLGFDAMSMTAGKDVVIWLNDGTFKLTDRSFIGVGSEPVMDAEQDWTIVSNTTSGGQRQVVATRLPNTGNPNDYVFSTSASSIDLVWSFEAGTGYIMGWHGANRGSTRESFTLGTQEVVKTEFSIYPNPSKSRLNVNLKTLSNDARIEVLDILGKKVYSNSLNTLQNTINVSKWHSGVYLVRISQANQVVTKRFVKQ